MNTNRNVQKDQFTKNWIIHNAIEILREYSGGITVRQLHYRLVSRGMTNDLNHYKRVVGAMTDARWEDIVQFNSFIDRDRQMYGQTEAEEKDLNEEIERAQQQVKAWMTSYHLNRWSNQENYIEVWIEKKALQGVFEMPCLRAGVGLAPCKGYPSLSFLYEAMKRFQCASEEDKNLVILYFGDYDPSGQNIPESLSENLQRMGVDIDVHRLALNHDQIEAMNLPGVPAKATDSRTRHWTGGDVVELDAVEPKTLEKMCKDAIAEYFDEGLHMELLTQEEGERMAYQQKLKDFVMNLQVDGKNKDGDEKHDE